MISARLCSGIVLLALLITGCAPMYIPNKVNTPLLSHKGESQVGGFIGSSGFDPQLSYAVTDHFGLMLNGSFQAGKDSTNNKHNFLEIGGGYYRKLSERGRFEVFAGYGAGNVQASYDNGIFRAYSDANVQRFFIQPDVGLTTRVVDAALAMRFVVVNARQNQFNLTRSFLEPAITIKLGYKYIKLVYQLGVSMPLNSNNLIEQQPVITSLGIQGYIGKGFAK